MMLRLYDWMMHHLHCCGCGCFIPLAAITTFGTLTGVAVVHFT